MNMEYIFSEILIPLISVNPSLEMVGQLLQTSKLLHKTILSSSMIWIILANTMSCSYCFYQFKKAADFSSLTGSLYWYEIVKALNSQRKIRRQWGLIFASQVLLNSGNKSVVCPGTSSPELPTITKRRTNSRKVYLLQQRKNPFKYQGSHLVKILDSFLQTEAKTLLTSSNFIRHWHDLTDFPKQLKDELICKDHMCSPSLCYGNLPNSRILAQIPKIQRLSGWMELEGDRFPTQSRMQFSSPHLNAVESCPHFLLQRGTLRIIDEEDGGNDVSADDDDEDDEEEEEKRRDNEEEKTATTANTNTLSNFSDYPDDIYILHAHNPQFSYLNGHGEITNSTRPHPPLNNSPDRSMKLALDDDTSLTRYRRGNHKLQIAYCPQMISRMVLDSTDAFFGENRHSPRRKRWRRIIASVIRSIFTHSQERNALNHRQSVENSTDWLLNQIYLSVSGGIPTSSVVKWYATFITDINTSPPESRLIVVAVCFDINGSIARVSGITSSKNAFRVLGN